MHEHDRFRRNARRFEQLLLIGESIAQDHGRGREIPEDELVALLGDLRRRRDIDDERNALLLGDLRDRGGLAGVESAYQKLRTIADQFFGPRSRHLHVGFGIGVHDSELGKAELLEDRRRQLDAALTILPDARLGSRARQQNADLERSTLCTREVARRGGEQSGGPGAYGKAAAGEAGRIGCCRDHSLLPRWLEARLPGFFL